MEEMTTVAVEATETTDAFMDGWEEATEATPPDQAEEQAEAEQQEKAETPASEDAGEGTETTEAADQQKQEPSAENAQTADAPKTWTLQHMDESKTVGEAEMVSLAQKGLDYDRLRTKYDEFKPVVDLFNQFANKAGVNTRDYITMIRTQAMQNQGMSEAEAKRAVELEDREAAVSVREAEQRQRTDAESAAAQAKQSADERRRADIAEFQKTFPDAAKDPKAIPKEVWDDVRGGASLVAAYSKYAVSQAKAAQAAAEQKAAVTEKNASNAARSTGSMKSAGQDKHSSDPFLDGFGE